MSRATRGMVILLTLPFTWAQTPQHETVFPTDSQAAEQSNGAGLLAAVCPNAVTTDKDGRIGCAKPCPDGADFAKEDFPWWLEEGTFGHFRSHKREEEA